MDKTQQLMVFAIDDKLRTITMPNNGLVFGVSGDIEVNQVEFQMPRYCAGFDMTDFTGRVNYVNPNGDSNYYEAEISGTDDAVSFIWPSLLTGLRLRKIRSPKEPLIPTPYSRTIFRLRKIHNMYMVYPLKTNFRLIKYDISILTEHI